MSGRDICGNRKYRAFVFFSCNGSFVIWKDKSRRFFVGDGGFIVVLFYFFKPIAKRFAI